MIGGALGGPPGLVAGAAAGAALGSLGGQVAEHGINEKIKDKDLQTEKGDFSDLRKRDLLGNAALDTAVSAATAGLWNTTGAKELVKDGSKEVAKKVLTKLGTGGASKIVFRKGVEKIVAAGCKNVVTAPIKATKSATKKIMKNCLEVKL